MLMGVIKQMFNKGQNETKQEVMISEESIKASEHDGFWNQIELIQVDGKANYDSIMDYLRTANDKAKVVEFAADFEVVSLILENYPNFYNNSSKLFKEEFSDDDWIYFRSWVIYEGRDTINALLDNPEILKSKYKKNHVAYEDFHSMWFYCSEDEDANSDIVDAAAKLMTKKVKSYTSQLGGSLLDISYEPDAEEIKILEKARKIFI